MLSDDRYQDNIGLANIVRLLAIGFKIEKLNHSKESEKHVALARRKASNENCGVPPASQLD